MALQHHIRLGPEHLEGNGDVGRYVFLPGDPSRAEKIAAFFQDLEVVESPRGLTARLGRLEATDEGPPIEVLVLPSGIGSASTEVVVCELVACGARRIVRAGSCGTCVAEISPGQVVLATGAVRDEDTSRHYAPPEYPALAHPEALAAMVEGARRAGLAAETFQGVCHSKGSLYAREFGYGPAGGDNLAYTDWIKRCGVVASEMEASTLFIVAAAHACEPRPLGRRPSRRECQAAAVLAVFARDDSNMEFDAELARLGEERAIKVALEGVRVWAERDRTPDRVQPDD